MQPRNDPFFSSFGLVRPSDFFQIEGQAAFVTDRMGTLLACEPGGEDFLETGDFLIRQNKVLTGASDELQEAFEAGLDRAVRQDTIWTGKHTGTFVIVRSLPNRQSVLWRVLPALPDQPTPPAGWDKAFAMTPAEAAVCRLLLKPGTEAEIALVLGLSIETVRTHRKRIYQKLAIAERADLVRLAWRLSFSG